MPSGLLEPRPFRSPWMHHGTKLFWLLVLLAGMGQGIRSTPPGQSSGLWIPLGLVFAITVFQVARMVRPKVTVWLDGAGVHLSTKRRSNDPGAGGPQFAGWGSGRWVAYRGMARINDSGNPALSARFELRAGQHPAPLQRHLVVLDDDISNPLDDLEWAVRDEAEYDREQCALEQPKREPAAEVPRSPAQHAGPPLLTTSRRIATASPLWRWLALYLVLASASIAILAIYEANWVALLFPATVGGITLLLLAADTNRRLRSRTIIDRDGARTVGAQQLWSLPWQQVLDVQEIYTSSGGTFVALLHREDPAPRIIGHPHQYSGLRLVPPFRLIRATLPEDHPATGWCLIPTHDLDVDHGAILDACLRGGQSVQVTEKSA